MRQLQVTTALFLILASLSATAEPILVIGGDGKLHGITGLTVEGGLYDVALVDGTCIASYSGCDSLADFLFTSKASAIAASQALLDAVVGSVFEHAPTKINGCVDQFNCYMNTPYGFVFENVRSAPARLRGGSATNVALDGNFSFPRSQNFATIDAGTLAVWSRSVAVPEPGTLALFGLGLLGLAFARRFRSA